MTVIKELADKFSDFFLNKILKIRELFTGIDPLNIKPKDGVPVLRKFATISDCDVKLLISEIEKQSLAS